MVVVERLPCRHSEEVAAATDEESALAYFKEKQIPLPPRRSELWSAVRMRDRDDRMVGAIG
jgi:hypothetical protein